MKALVLHNPGHASIENIPDPVVTNGDVLLKVGMVGVSLSLWASADSFSTLLRRA
jgi:NADPH:quinone reductase-like Zn-dependent oxidoreductase